MRDLRRDLPGGAFGLLRPLREAEVTAEARAFATAAAAWRKMPARARRETLALIRTDEDLARLWRDEAKRVDWPEEVPVQEALRLALRAAGKLLRAASRRP